MRASPLRTMSRPRRFRLDATILLGLIFVTAIVGLVSNMFFVPSFTDLRIHLHLQPQSSTSINFVPRGLTTEGASETVLFSRLQQDIEQRRTKCMNVTTHAAGTQRLLQPYGLLSSLQNRNTSSSSLCTTPDDSWQSCHVNAYAVLVVVSASERPRSILIHCMELLLDSNAKEIYILTPTHADRIFDDPYGQRLVRWHNQTNHPVRVVSTHTLWDAIQHVHTVSQQTAIVWTRLGDKVDHTGGMQLWKSHSAGMYAKGGWLLSKPECANNDDVRLVKANEPVPRDSFLIPSIQGLVHHREHLCFLQHPVLERLRLATQNWHVSMLAMTLWFSLATPNPVILYEGAFAKKRDAKHLDDALKVPTAALSDLISFFGGFPVQSRVTATNTCQSD